MEHGGMRICTANNHEAILHSNVLGWIGWCNQCSVALWTAFDFSSLT
jgi:hypothetical protein